MKHSLLFCYRWLMSLLHVSLFLLILCSFHIFLVLTYPIVGKRVFNGPIALMNRCLMLNMQLCGIRLIINKPAGLPTTGPVILVSNHQSMYDIPIMIWELRSLYPRFISKKELAKGAPSISLALRKGDHLLIDRRDPKSALTSIKQWAKRMNEERQTVGLFAEGTRARDGVLKPFKIAGFRALREAMPEAPIVAVAIDGLWRVVRHKLLPIPVPCTVKVTFFEPILPSSGYSSEEILAECHRRIAQALDQEGKEVA